MTRIAAKSRYLPEWLRTDVFLFWLPLVLLVSVLVFMTHSYWSLPIFWDEAMPYVAPSLKISRAGLWHHYDSRQAIGHPQGFIALLAVTLRAFGEARETLRFLMTMISAGCLVLVALVGRRLGGKVTGLLAALVLLCSRDFFARSYHVLPDTLLIFLGLASVYATFREKPLIVFVLTASFAALVKETALAFLAVCAFAQLWFWRRSLTGGRLMLVLLPLLVLPLFFLLERYLWGQFTNFPFTNTFVGNFAEYWRNWKAYGYYFFDYSLGGLFPLVALASFGGVAASFRQQFDRRVLVLLGIIFCFLSGTAFWNVVNFRYLTPAVPMAALLIAWGMRSLVAEGPLRALIVASTLILFRPDYFHVFPNVAGAPEQSLAYANFVKETQAALLDLSAKYPEGKIATFWPFYEVMQDPFFGFVVKGREMVLEPAQADFILIATAIPPERRLRLERWVEVNKLKLLEKKELGSAGTVWWFDNK